MAACGKRSYNRSYMRVCSYIAAIFPSYFKAKVECACAASLLDASLSSQAASLSSRPSLSRSVLVACSREILPMKVTAEHELEIRE